VSIPAAHSLDLRHTFATLLILQGESLASVRDQMSWLGTSGRMSRRSN